MVYINIRIWKNLQIISIQILIISSLKQIKHQVIVSTIKNNQYLFYESIILFSLSNGNRKKTKLI